VTAAPDSREREALHLSLLNDFLYCPRRAALKIVEGWREANAHTERGDIVHEHSDLAGRESQISNLKSQILLRALPVWSDHLGISGRCDIVEVEQRVTSANLKSQIPDLKSRDIAALRPVEFKLGRRRQWENDDAQLCAQALCLEEMFEIPVLCGAIFHADSKRRREVGFTPELRQCTERAIRELHALLRPSDISNLKSEIPPLPAANYRPACKECSLFDICLPHATGASDRAARLARQLFEIQNPNNPNLKSKI
jgi:CRISPR-associated exonuclease Cas4